MLCISDPTRRIQIKKSTKFSSDRYLSFLTRRRRKRKIRSGTSGSGDRVWRKSRDAGSEVCLRPLTQGALEIRSAAEARRPSDNKMITREYTDNYRNDNDEENDDNNDDSDERECGWEENGRERFERSGGERGGKGGGEGREEKQEKREDDQLR